MLVSFVAVTAALRSAFAAGIKEVIENSLATIGCLACGSAANQAQLGKFGACAGE